MIVGNFNRRKLLILVAVIITIFIILLIVFSGGEDTSQTTQETTTTTTLPPKDAQACEYLTDDALLAAGIISDVNAKPSENLKRCTYEDIGGTVNYITLYVDDKQRCQIWIDDAKETTALPSVSPGAVYIEDIDPTIVVEQNERCFFLQGSKTIIDKESLIEIAVVITQTFQAVDSTTTTTEPVETVVVPEDTDFIPGVNRPPSSLTTTTT